MTWRIAVDDDLCQGHGVCESEAPEVFRVSKAGQLTVLDPTPPEDRRTAVEQAVRYCPTHALRIDETAIDETAIDETETQQPETQE